MFSQASWYGVYAELRQYSPIVRLCDTKVPQVKVLSPTQQLKAASSLKLERRVPRKASFMLLESDTTGELRLLKNLECGSTRVPITFTRSVKIKRNTAEKSFLLNRESRLTVLNNDCLRKIFELLKLNDLASIARTCTRFNGIAFKPRRDRLRETIRLSPDEWSLQQCEELFLHHGQDIKSICIAEHPIFTDLMLGFIGRYCPKIERLACCRLNGMLQTLDSYNKLFPAVMPLGVIAANYKKSQPFKTLEELNYFSSVCQVKSLPCIALSGLRHFIIKGAKIRNIDHFVGFFTKNLNVRVLSTYVTSLEDDPHSIMFRLFRVTEMNSIDTEFHGPHSIDENVLFGYLPNNLASLKWFPLKHQLYARNHIFYSNVPIKHLKHLEWRTTEYPEVIERFQGLRKLKLFNLGPDGVRRFTEYVRKNRDLELISNGLTGEDGMIGFKKIDIDKIN